MVLPSDIHFPFCAHNNPTIWTGKRGCYFSWTTTNESKQNTSPGGNSTSSGFVSHHYKTYPGHSCFLHHNQWDCRVSPISSSCFLIQTCNGLFQVPACNDLTDDTLFAEGRRSAAGGSLPGTNCEQDQSLGNHVFPSSERYEWEGKRHTTQHISSVVVGDPLFAKYLLQRISLYH